MKLRIIGRKLDQMNKYRANFVAGGMIHWESDRAQGFDYGQIRICPRE